MKADSAVRSTLRQYIVENFLYMQPGLEFGDDDSLLRAGIIDSLGVMELVTFVEETWDVDVDVYGITEATFGSISAIARFLAQQGAGRTMNAA
jgi:acyl carrier protein